MLVHIVFVCLFQQAVAVPFAPQWPTHSQLEVTSEETNPTSQSGQKLHADPNNGMMRKKIRTSLAVREVYSDGVVHEADPDEETWDDTWHDLSPEQKEDWEKLGWNEEMWDKGEKEPDTYDLDWNQLPDDQKRAAADLGYDEQTWNDEEEDANDAAAPPAPAPTVPAPPEGEAAEAEDAAEDTEAPAECAANYFKGFHAFVEAHKDKMGSAERLQAALTEIITWQTHCFDTGIKDDAWKSKLVDENKCASLPDKDAKRLTCDEGSECIAGIKEEAQTIVNTCISAGIKTFKIQLDMKFQHDWFTCIVDHIDDHCQQQVADAIQGASP